jgi:uncharacterized repeat protein (TIGR03803 family)
VLCTIWVCAGNLAHSQTLYSFCGQSKCPDGAGPASLLLATDGNLYGETGGGGTSGGGGQGTIYKITPGGALTTLYIFCVQSGCPDGAYPSGLMQASDGNLYGTTSAYGFYEGGTIFQITPGGMFTTLFNFCPVPSLCPGSPPTGGESYGGLVQATSGDFYGATMSTDAFSYGSVYEFSIGLKAFVKTLPTSATVGSSITILGTDLTGATRVTFNGTEARFKSAA